MSIALGLVAAVGGLFLLGVVAQRKLLYFPDRETPAAAAARAARGGLEPVRDPRGGIVGWLAPHPSHRPAATALVLHGNAGSALDRRYLVEVLRGPGVPPLDVVLLEYPGYGPRPGAPSEGALVAAAVDAVDRLASAGRPIVLVGESLGSAVAALAAAERPAVAGLVLVTPLASVTAVARRHYGVPAFLVHDRFEAAPALARYGGRAVFVLAGADEVVFTDLGRALHDAYAGPKRLVVQEGATHNGLRYDPRDPAWRDSIEFLLAR
jgi:fermentation-respiration switch protein FrsA (DUF1100 family)